MFPIKIASYLSCGWFDLVQVCHLSWIGKGASIGLCVAQACHCEFDTGPGVDRNCQTALGVGILLCRTKTIMN
jgi:hypothetical protein